jgi:phytol kinase
VHTLAGPLFLVCWPLFSSAPYAQYLAALVPSLNGLRLLLVGSGAVSNPRAVAALSRTGDPAELLRGPLYYVVVLLAVTALCWRGSPVGVLVVALMCGGDGLADIVGRRWGDTNRLPWNPEKSWAGSAAMFGGGLATAAALLTYFSALGYIAVDVPSAVTALVAVSAAATAIESLPMNKVLDDNLSVPGVAAVLGAAMLQAVVVL